MLLFKITPNVPKYRAGNQLFGKWIHGKDLPTSGDDLLRQLDKASPCGTTQLINFLKDKGIYQHMQPYIHNFTDYMGQWEHFLNNLF